LLYHHVDASAEDHRYYVAPEQFEQEMKAFRDWGYTTITVKSLVQAITEGRELPPHPMLITFDDGHRDIYTNAFPIMQKYGFKGVLYVVGNYLGAEGFMDRTEILEMYQAGWDVGSHGMKHIDVTKLFGDDLLIEVEGSRQKLENTLGIEILTFAYPFGAKDKTSVDYVQAAGYIAAMGAEGYRDSQGNWNLFDLQRVEIQGTESIESLTRFLTWKGNDE
jgi:Predicted xylanase/chitin deacetylase